MQKWTMRYYCEIMEGNSCLIYLFKWNEKIYCSCLCERHYDQEVSTQRALRQCNVETATERVEA